MKRHNPELLEDNPSGISTSYALLSTSTLNKDLHVHRSARRGMMSLRYVIYGSAKTMDGKTTYVAVIA